MNKETFVRYLLTFICGASLCVLFLGMVGVFDTNENINYSGYYCFDKCDYCFDIAVSSGNENESFFVDYFTKTIYYGNYENYTEENSTVCMQVHFDMREYVKRDALVSERENE